MEVIFGNGKVHFIRHGGSIIRASAIRQGNEFVGMPHTHVVTEAEPSGHSKEVRNSANSPSTDTIHHGGFKQ